MEYLIDILTKCKNRPSEELESEVVEFKHYNNEKSLHNAKELSEEISALANCKGGHVIIGVKDNVNVKHGQWHEQLAGFDRVDLDTTKERFIGKLSPKIDLNLKEIFFEEKYYLAIEVPNIIDSLVSTTSGKVCIRVGKSSMPATPYKITQLVKSLQSYDWSDEDMPISIVNNINKEALAEAKFDYCERRSINLDSISDFSFLEAIGATKNGILNKGGLLFLGNNDSIKNNLGKFEYRFTWKKKSGELILNEVWDDCLWSTINRAKDYFHKCNFKWDWEYEGEKYPLSTLDEVAFHEAFLNSIVHRDYSAEGMISINFTGNKIVITNPGSFYGGVNSKNISYHEPRHRNKSLAKLLMGFQMVDRAGMGVLRMSVNSLKYGRNIPSFKETIDSIEVEMEAIAFKAGVFLITQKYVPDCGITELLILNNIFEIGFVSVSEMESILSNIVANPWESILESLNDDYFKKYVTLKASNKGVFICPTDNYAYYFDANKPFKNSVNSEKHIKLYKLLKTYGSANNEVIMNHLGFKNPSSTWNFLSKLAYVVNKGKSRNSKWILKQKQLTPAIASL